MQILLFYGSCTKRHFSDGQLPCFLFLIKHITLLILVRIKKKTIYVLEQEQESIKYFLTEAYECTEMLPSMAISQLSIFRVVLLDHDF